MFLFFFFFFFFNDTATTEIYTLSLHDALPISRHENQRGYDCSWQDRVSTEGTPVSEYKPRQVRNRKNRDRKSTRLNSSHTVISYAVFCLKKKKQTTRNRSNTQLNRRHKRQRDL